MSESSSAVLKEMLLTLLALSFKSFSVHQLLMEKSLFEVKNNLEEISWTETFVCDQQK
jgi:hypothetical protein